MPWAAVAFVMATSLPGSWPIVSHEVLINATAPSATGTTHWGTRLFCSDVSINLLIRCNRSFFPPVRESDSLVFATRDVSRYASASAYTRGLYWVTTSSSQQNSRSSRIIEEIIHTKGLKK